MLLPKILDNIIAGKLSSLIKNVIINEQHGFVANRSTLTNLSLFHYYVSQEIENGHQIDVIYTDFGKAFDTVNHSLILNKLPSFGISGEMLSWFGSYLSNRTQVVGYKNARSRRIMVPSGMPQGSHLGPPLFTIFINDIASVLKHREFLLYADDLKIFRRIESPLDASLLQQDLSSLAE